MPRHNAFIALPNCPFKNLHEFAEYFVEATKLDEGKAIQELTAHTKLSNGMGKKQKFPLLREVRIRAKRALSLKLTKVGRIDELPFWESEFDRVVDAAVALAEDTPYVSIPSKKDEQIGETQVDERPGLLYRVVPDASRPTPPVICWIGDDEAPSITPRTEKRNISVGPPRNKLKKNDP